MEFWNKCSERLENKLSQDDFNTWIRPLKASLNENTLELVAPNDFILNYVESNLAEEITQMVKTQSSKHIQKKHLSINIKIKASLRIQNLFPHMFLRHLSKASLTTLR